MANDTEPWAWVVLVASFMALLLNTSMSFNAGVMHVALLETFPDDVTITSWIGSLYSCMFALAGPFASFIINHWNCQICVVISGILGLIGFSASSLVSDIRWMFVTYAFLAGLGQGLCFTGCLVLLGYYFKKRTSLATGVGIAGCGVGNFIMPPLTQALIDAYNLDGAFLLMGGLAFQATACGALMRRSKFERMRRNRSHLKSALLNSNTASGDVNFFKTFKNIFSGPYIAFLVSVLSFTMGCSTLKLYLPNFFIQQGSTHQQASYLVSVTGIGSIISRLSLGFASSDPNIGSAILYSGVNGICGIFIFFLTYITVSQAGRVIFAIVYGFYNGGCWALFNPMTYDIVGIEKLASATGLVMFVCGIGYLIGAPIAASLFQISGDYGIAFMYSALAFLVTSFCALLTVCLNTRKLKYREAVHQTMTTDCELRIQPEEEEFLS